MWILEETTPVETLEAHGGLRAPKGRYRYVEMALESADMWINTLEDKGYLIEGCGVEGAWYALSARLHMEDSGRHLVLYRDTLVSPVTL